MDLGPCFVYVCFHVHVYNEKQAQLGVVHGPGPQRWSMDRVHGVVHGPGPQGWSMDPGPCFVYVPRQGGCVDGLFVDLTEYNYTPAYQKLWFPRLEVSLSRKDS